MAWIPVQSSMLDAFDYDAALGVLHLRLKSGAIMDYRDVPPDVAQGLADAPSAGKFFHRSIKGRFQPL